MNLHNSLNKSSKVMGGDERSSMEETDGANRMNGGKIFTAASVARRLKQKLSTPPVDKNENEIKPPKTSEKNLRENQRSTKDSENGKTVKIQTAATAAASSEEEEERLSKSSSSMASPPPSSSSSSSSSSSLSSPSSPSSPPLLPPTLVLSSRPPSSASSSSSSSPVSLKSTISSGECDEDVEKNDARNGD